MIIPASLGSTTRYNSSTNRGTLLICCSSEGPCRNPPWPQHAPAKRRLLISAWDIARCLCTLVEGQTYDSLEDSQWLRLRNGHTNRLRQLAIVGTVMYSIKPTFCPTTISQILGIGINETQNHIPMIQWGNMGRFIIQPKAGGHACLKCSWIGDEQLKKSRSLFTTRQHENP